MNCSCHRAVRLHEHGMNMAESVMKKQSRIATVNEMQFDSIPEKLRNDAVLILSIMQQHITPNE